MALSNKMKVSQKVKDAIEEMIFSKMHAGDKLPTEGELAEMFAVSRTTVREALKGLEASKMLEKRNGGTYIVEKVWGCFIDPLCIMIQLNTIKQSEIMDVRLLLETEAAGEAAVNAEPDQIKELENIVWLMRKPGIQIEEYIDLDVKFHYMVAKASSNQMLYQLIRDISTVIVKFYPRCCTLEIAESTAIPQLIKVIDAVKNRDAQAAKMSMRQHLQECDEIIRK